MIRESAVRNWNPWWKDPSSIQNDQKIKDWENSTIKYIPQLKYEIIYDSNPSNTIVYSLCGPRQVGKTTLVKLQIREFLDKNISPWNIFYHVLDLVNTPQDIVDAIEIYLKTSAKWRKDNRYYLFLDEVLSVHEWQKGIKWLVDCGKLPNCTVVATGSHTVNIRNAAERLPGRRGMIHDNHDKILLPMKFSEYALLDNDIKNLISKNNLLPAQKEKIFLKLLNREIDDTLYELYAYQNELHDLLHDYMITGGTPRIIDEKIKTSAIDENLYVRYMEGITGQWSALAKNETLLRQFCKAIMCNQGNPVSWNRLSKDAALGSPNTALDYTCTLKDLFVLSIVYRYGSDKKIPMIQQDKKFYFRDPYFLHIFNGLTSTGDSFGTSLDYIHEEDNQGKIVEGIVSDHLIRLAFAQSRKKQAFDYTHHVFYWKKKKKREVDFILFDGDKIEIPIEVKYRNKINHKELSGLVSFLGKTNTKSGLVISKSYLEEKSEYIVIPASLFLLLI